MTAATQTEHNDSSQGQKTELGLVRILPWGDIRPSLQNDYLYRPVDDNNPDLKALADSIRKQGILEPIVVTQDYVIVSGHRRHAAARLARLREVPCRVIETLHSRDSEFLPLLREHNRQREKTFAEKLREEIVSANPEEAWRDLIVHRNKQNHAAADQVSRITIEGSIRRAKISDAKKPMLDACLSVLKKMKSFWPLSDRQIHYQLLNAPPLIHASKLGRYQNNPASYKALTELLTRARLEGSIPMNAIADPTRPVAVWDVHTSTTPFLRREIAAFLKGYFRNRQQDQPNHIEVVGEKNTLTSILRPVAREYTIPLTIGRGYASLQPRHELAQRFLNSGKDNLVLLILSDFDPDGEEICQSFARSLRDDFDFSEVQAVKVALTEEQVTALNLPPGLEAKKSSSNYAKFESKYGQVAYELESVPPVQLQQMLRQAIEAVMDLDIYNQQVEAEKQDAADLKDARQLVQKALSGLIDDDREED